MTTVFLILGGVALMLFAIIVRALKVKRMREVKEAERGLKMIAMLIHLPPTTDDIQAGGRDERDVVNEAVSQAQVMYSIIASTLVKGKNARIFGQKHISFEIVASGGMIKYFAVVPAVLTETVKQAIVSAYPTARVEETERENIFSKTAKLDGVAGGELSLKKEYVYPIATYEQTKRDASTAILNTMSALKDGEGLGVQIMFRPKDGAWTKNSETWVKSIKEGKTKKTTSGANIIFSGIEQIFALLWKPLSTQESNEKHEEIKVLTNIQQDEISAVEDKTRYAAFETLVRIVGSSEQGRSRAEAMVGGVVTAFSQFDSPAYNGFKYEMAKDIRKLARDYIFRDFPLTTTNNVLNAVELASIFHLPEQNAIPTSQVMRQLTKQVEGPAKLVDDGVLIGINEFRGEKKEIRLSVEDRRRHVYVIGSTGMGKSKFLRNIAYQDMQEGRGFAFIDPHGDVAEELLSMVPKERVDDVIYFDPGDMENPIGMNMFEYQTADQKDFIIQEGINMLYSLYDPGHTGIFGPRGEHMFRNAALLLMSDPNGASFIDIPRVFIDPEFVKAKLKYVTDRQVYDYWTKEFPASQRSNDAGEVTTWFVSKWGPFISNTMMKNVLGQTKSGFNIRDIMDNNKILLVNLSKGKMGELNSKLLGMIFVMKFQAAAMSRVDTPEDDRKDFCLFVDEFQNFSTDSFESILSEARKFRLNLIVANQFMTQLTDKIREGVLGNVGTIIAGRLGVTDAELIEKVFAPTFTAEDLHKTPNYHAVATVMMYGMPSTPFTMTWPVLGKESPEVLQSLKTYSAAKYGRPRAEVSKEIDQRLAASNKEGKVRSGEDAASVTDGNDNEETDRDNDRINTQRVYKTTDKEEREENFLEAWLRKKSEIKNNDTETDKMGSDEPHPSAGREMESSHRERQVDRRDIEAEELIKNTPSRDAALRENKGDDGFWKADDKISLRP
ncbi:type IV secretory system conjugative DNA transfer family protein [Candidatus Saccharibacteria bacterium]|nr:type IV secretory system conjugative DNA transfer family protein [Candidatus Saccharibacteria bacterium]